LSRTTYRVSSQTQLQTCSQRRIQLIWTNVSCLVMNHWRRRRWLLYGSVKATLTDSWAPPHVAFPDAPSIFSSSRKRKAPNASLAHSPRGVSSKITCRRCCILHKHEQASRRMESASTSVGTRPAPQSIATHMTNAWIVSVTQKSSQRRITSKRVLQTTQLLGLCVSILSPKFMRLKPSPLFTPPSQLSQCYVVLLHPSSLKI
jgi:hypothetical protein